MVCANLIVPKGQNQMYYRDKVKSLLAYKIDVRIKVSGRLTIGSVTLESGETLECKHRLFNNDQLFSIAVVYESIGGALKNHMQLIEVDLPGGDVNIYASIFVRGQ